MAVLEMSVALPDMTELLVKLVLMTGTEAPLWQASQSTPVAVSQAASMLGSPLEVKLLVHK